MIASLISFLLSVTITAIRHPVPGIHDEFGNLLAGETFASGRITNPTHPMWQHFESFHIFHQPSYMSKYPPGLGAFLAIGELFGGQPIIGVWLSTALATGAIVWMLQGWVSRKWAFYGGLLVAFHPYIQFYWGQSYYGGTVTVIGSALLIGGYGRLRNLPSVKTYILMALGLIILANTRPYEGFALSLPIVLASIIAIAQHYRTDVWKSIVVRCVIASLGVLGIGASIMLYYNHRITGDAFQFPYQAHEKIYSVQPTMIWQKYNAVPKYRHKVIHDYWTMHGKLNENSRPELKSLVNYRIHNSIARWHELLRPTLTLPLLFLPFIMRLRSIKLIVFGVFTVIFADIFSAYSGSRYLAPTVPLLILLVVQGTRYFRCIRIGKFHFKFAHRGILALNMAACLIILAMVIRHEHFNPNKTSGWRWSRVKIMEQLKAKPGKHLIIVKYNPNHDTDHEWVYNRADIDNSKVVWARDMSRVENQELFKYYSNRTIWTILADEKNPHLIPFVPDRNTTAQSKRSLAHLNVNERNIDKE